MDGYNPLISVIIPTYFRNDYLREAIKSIVEQTYDPIEVIVVDDSGEKYAEPVEKEYDIVYKYHDVNAGQTPARNTGLRAASGQYIQFLDDDDQLLSTKIERQLTLMQKQEDVGVVYCGVNKSGKEVYPKPDVKGDILKGVLAMRMGGCLFPASMLIDRNILEKITPLTPRKGADDIGLKIELAKRTQFDYVSEILVDRGIHDEQIGTTPKAFIALQDIIADYEDLYEKFPKNVRHSALYSAYRGHGYFLLREGISTDAVASCFKAAYHGLRTGRIEDTILGCGLAVTSLFGKPGLRLAQYLYMRLLPDRGKTAPGLP